MASCPLCDRADLAVIAATPHSYAFAATDPIRVGHVVAAPRRHVTCLADFTPEEAADFYGLVRSLSSAICAATPNVKVYQVYVGDMVTHFHMHLLPRGEDDAGLGPFIFDRDGWRGKAQQDVPDDALAAFVRDMRSLLGGNE